MMKKIVGGGGGGIFRIKENTQTVQAQPGRWTGNIIIIKDGLIVVLFMCQSGS